MPNVYKTSVQHALPRVLSLFDTNPISSKRGVGDRFYWSWKGKDFANGAFQGAVHGLALVQKHKLKQDDISSEALLNLVSSIISGTSEITRRNGSLDEILPYEASYCVTALAAFDILSALNILRNDLPQNTFIEHLNVVYPLINYISANDEKHGIITNHLAVAAAALALWSNVSGDGVDSVLDDKIDRILDARSKEGWFQEYYGADPGYQTLALDYLSSLDREKPDYHLAPLLRDSLDFLKYMAHPDGSFGGLYGSRNTRFLYPAGVEEICNSYSLANDFISFVRTAHENNTVVSLSSMDDSNLIPMFNSFCRAAAHYRPISRQINKLPFARAPFQKEFNEAGLIICRTTDSYSIINWRKGGAYYSSNAGVSGGILAKNKKGEWFSSQISKNARIINQTEDSFTVETPLAKQSQVFPNPLHFLILRLLSLSLMKVKFFNGLVKNILVWYLITRQKRKINICRRTVRLDPFSFEDEWVLNNDGLEFCHVDSFFFNHMASQGYWQKSDTN